MAIANRILVEEAVGALESCLRARLPEAATATVSDVEVPHTSGMSNETVIFTAEWDGATRRLVARVSPVDGGIYLRYDLDREQRIMTALARGTDLPVPEPLFVEHDTSVLGAPFLLMPYVTGESPADDPPFTVAGFVHELPPAGRGLVNDNALAAVAALHAVDWRALGLGDLAPASGTALDARLAADERWYAWAADGLEHPVVDAAFSWLREHRPTTEERLVLNWGDARLSNIIFADDHTVAAMVDWEMATIAPAARDLGWWLFAMRHHTDGIGAPLPDGYPTPEQLVHRYEELAGTPVEDLDYYEVLGGLEAALIMVRVGAQMTAAGLLPPGNAMAVVNPASLLLADLIGVERPAGDAASFIGNRG